MMTGLTANGRSAHGTLAVALTVAIAAATNALADDFFIDDGNVFALISAINAANGNDEEPATIHLAEDGHYLLELVYDSSWGGQGLPPITSEITIEGNGATIERSSEDGTPNFRFFFLHDPSGSDADLTLIDLTLNGGHSDKGGAIRNSGNTVTIIDSTISNSTAANGGGAILTAGGGVLTITGSTLIGNTAYRGGAINKHSHGGSVTITGSVILDNVATGIGGGGLFIESSGAHIITGTTISGNSAIASSGGGIRTGASNLTITDCTISGNSASVNGGGVNSSALTMTGTTLSGNTADNHGGALYANTTTNVTNCTFSGNSAANHGGGIFVQGTVNLTNCTVADNTAGSNGGGIYRNQTLNMSNSIVGYNTGGADVHNGFTDLGYNIVEDGGGLSEETSMSGDPMLGPLADNGGPTMTHALLPGSPALDAGDCADESVTEDQRGVPRPQGVACDIGAYELEGSSPCPGDLTGSGGVGVPDLLELLGCWGPVDPGGGCEIADLTGSGTVGVPDLLDLLGQWGPCPE